MVSKSCSKCGGWRARPGDIIEVDDPNNMPTRCRCDESLTFAEAMALDPSEVEFCPVPPKDKANHWWPFETWRQYGHMDMRRGSWRRARPKRSRVQEMADNRFGAGTHENYVDAKARSETVRAVCEWLRDTPRGYSDHDRQLAKDIEREFLEPR